MISMVHLNQCWLLKNIYRYAYPWWKEKEIDSEKKRAEGMCPLTPEETALTLRALDIDPNIQVYIAAGDIYKSEKKMTSLKEAFPNLVSENPFRTIQINKIMITSLLSL